MILTVFRSRLRDSGHEAYMALAPRISALAQSMPGYISHKIFVAQDGERLTLVAFDDEASQRAWAQQVDHVAAKRQGRESFYASYSIQVCEVLRSSSFEADTDA